MDLLKRMGNTDNSSNQIYLRGISAINQFHINLTRTRSKGSRIRLTMVDLRTTTQVFPIIEKACSRKTVSLLWMSLRNVRLLHDMDRSQESLVERIHHYLPGIQYHNLRTSPWTLMEGTNMVVCLRRWTMLQSRWLHVRSVVELLMWKDCKNIPLRVRRTKTISTRSLTPPRNDYKEWRKPMKTLV